MEKFLWLDCETTGLDPKKNTVHQVAGEIVINGVSVEEFNLEMKPHDRAEIQKEALAVSNLTVEQVMARKMTSGEAYRNFDRMLCRHVNKYDKEDKFVFCAYNSNFDAQFINEWYIKNKNKYFFGLCHGGAYFDPLQLALLLEIKSGKRLFRPNRKLATVAKYFNVPLDNAHDALADIRATREIAKILFERITKS